MSGTATVQVRVNQQTKADARAVLTALDMSMSEAICLFLRQVVLQRGIPFDVKIPNELTAKTLAASEKGIDLHRASGVDDLFEELDS
ncbi:MAG: type II toxin-antitoxin system RelB/DinJ family antitoxin [Planctomycetes bacterium]|nr:type II toxin-antitoxin system RelB/DinJ family antitoxin [Planctomycetota bacterium]